MKRRAWAKQARRRYEHEARVLKRGRGAHDRATFYVTHEFWPGDYAASMIYHYEDVIFYLGGTFVAKGTAELEVTE